METNLGCTSLRRNTTSLEPIVAAAAFPVRALNGHASAGHFVVHFVAGQMVGNRRFPGATRLGALCQPSLVPPNGSELRDASWTVYEMAGPGTFWWAQVPGCNDLHDVAASLSPAVAAAAVLCVDVAASMMLTAAAAMASSPSPPHRCLFSPRPSESQSWTSIDRKQW